jgi:hypothetical protein
MRPGGTGKMGGPRRLQVQDRLLNTIAQTTRSAGLQRCYALCLAGAGWFALALQFTLTLSERIEAGRSVAGGVVHLLSFFTILTNLLVAGSLTLQALAPDAPTARRLARPAAATGIAASIVFVGIAYSLLLRHLSHVHGLAFLANTLMHDEIPPLYLLYWWCFVPPAALGASWLLRWSLYPVLYFVYVLARGALFGVYPYPFIDVGQLGYALALRNAVGVLVGFWLVGALVAGAGRLKFRGPAGFAREKRR